MEHCRWSICEWVILRRHKYASRRIIGMLMFVIGIKLLLICW